MYVRAFDNQRNVYFRSQVYAVINLGFYEKQLLVFSLNGDSYFKFFECIDKSNPKTHKVLINSIHVNACNPDTEWIHEINEDIDKNLDEYATVLDSDIRFFEYEGYSWIYENKPLLTELLKGGVVSTKDYENKMLATDAYKLENWHYVENPQDIDFIFAETNGFHDSVLKELNYVSGSYVDAENQMYDSDNVRQLILRFDSQWCRSIELVFDGVISLNLRPFLDNETSFLYDASLFVQDETIFFFDSQIDSVDTSYDGTWVQSYGLRWRFYGENLKRGI
ncbi:MAG: hypothetical protein FWG87_13565 [Defluviitaleaceae bacterium]|nr:hypothetical protein [Defluviitaleaceae bacterium]